ncbi:DUF819 family protein [Thalassolituus sp. LLYu03]|uniref:DUF819 family protein n=1 Tax=Thalassolituus sp. LLYu03 TaxID=3421656 RepID=UPI003D278906
MTLAALILFVVFPAVLIVLSQRIRLLDKIGVVVLSFICGIALSALRDFIPGSSELSGLQSTLSEVSIALALPLLVFSIDVKASLSMAGNTMKAMGLALLSVIVVSAAGAIAFADSLPQVWQIAGMSVGAYTGGGPNMAAIKTAIEADDTLFTTMITYDILLSALYLLFVMTLAKPIFSRLLRPFESRGEHAYHNEEEKFGHLADETANAYRILARPPVFVRALLALLLSGLIVGVSVGLSKLVPGSMSSAVTIISITTLGVLASFVPAVRNLPGTFQLGMYLILVFCFTTGAMTDSGILTHLNYALFAYIGLILLGSLVLQALLCKLLKIDTDTFLITSSAAIMSVPFIPVIAGALKNREIILPGFAAAIIGYIVGNYLGIGVAFFSRWWLGA